MFTKRDFVSYFSEIEQFEQNMRDYYAEASGQIKDREVRKIFEDLSDAEEKHAKMVDELRRIAIQSGRLTTQPRLHRGEPL